MKYFLILFVLLFSAPMKGQDGTDLKKWMFGVTLSPDLCYRTLKKNSDDPSLDFLIKFRNNEEVIRPGYTAGFLVRYNFRQNLYFESGLQYATKGEKTINKPVYTTHTGGNEPTSVRFIYYYNYIECPLKINMVFKARRSTFYASAGIITGYLVNSGSIAKVTYSDGHKETNRENNTFYDYNTISFSPAIGIGMERRMTDKLSLKFGPEFRHGVRTIILAPLKGYLWSLGFNAGLYLHL